MKLYNYILAGKIIDTYNDLDVLDRASLGLHEDWFWTAEEIWSKGEYQHPLPGNLSEIYEDYVTRRKNGMSIFDVSYSKDFTDKFIGGLAGSIWATPVLQVDLKDGSIGTFNCYIDDGVEVDILNKISREMNGTQGCFSRPVREWRDENISIGDFKEKKDEKTNR